MTIFLINTSLPIQKKINYFTSRYPCKTNHDSNFRTTDSSISLMLSYFIFPDNYIFPFLRFI